MTENNKIIHIDTFNPYEYLFPNRKIITRDVLLLVKTLRNEGYQVIFNPENDQPIQYLYRKGLQDFFSDPINLLLIGIPLDIFNGLLINFIQKHLDKNEIVNSKNINIKIDNSTTQYNYFGEMHPHNHYKEMEEKKKIKKKLFKKSFELKSPFDDLPTPIFLEHEPKIVGWCKLINDDYGLKCEMIILDKLTKRRIKQNRLNGLSITGIATKTQCSICNSDYVYCNHIAKNIYDNKECYNTILETDYVETSIVKEPINSQCLINYKN